MTKFKAKLIITIVILLFSLSLCIVNQQNKTRTTESSGSALEIQGDPLIIINNNGDFVTYAELGGAGTPGNPYIIQNKIIDGNGSDCISITDTNAHFIIQNCILYDGNYGIKGYNVSNGKLLNNIITFCGSEGIIFEGNPVNSNINIINNTINSNNEGIELYEMVNCQVINNTCNHNTYGLNYWNVNNTECIGNEVFNNSIMGFYLDNTCWNNLFQGNNFSLNDGEGVYMTDRCFYNIFLDNIINNNTGNGIFIHDRWNNYNIFINNTAKFNGDCGYRSLEGAHNWFENNIAMFNAYDGFFFESPPGNGENCSIINNEASYNYQSGIRIETDQGINISYNQAINNSNYGIHLEYTDFHWITFNNLTLNMNNGIYMDYSDANNISFNTINQNTVYGIFIKDSNGNNITWNVMHGNSICILPSGGGTNLIANNSCAAAGLTNGFFTPSNGNTDTSFNFTVIYTDLDNMAPFSVRLFVNGIAYDMTKADPNDNDFTDGCVYTVVTKLPKGDSQIYFEAYEITNRLVTVQEDGPSVKGSGIPWMPLYLLLSVLGLLIIISYSLKQQQWKMSQKF